MISALHERWVALLESLPEADFQRGYTHPGAWPAGSHERAGTLFLALAPSHGAHHQSAHQDVLVAEVPSGAESLSPAKLAEVLEDYLAGHPTAALLEDGRVLFDMRLAHYSVTESHGRCLLQLWSEERNLVRTVIDVQHRAQCLRVMTRRMGAPKPQALELVPSSDRRTPTARDSARRNYQRLLERVLTRAFIGAKIDGLRSAMDLEHSFGPAYVRGRLLRGTAADAVIGVSEAESSATIDGILTLGILWLDYCREKGDARRHFGGLKVIVPAGSWRTTAERMAWLNHSAADFQLFTLDERSEELESIDFRDSGNQIARLVHAFSTEAALERCGSGIGRVMTLLPDGAKDRVEIRPRSATEVGLMLHGLEFARVRHGASSPLVHARGGDHVRRRSQRNPAHRRDRRPLSRTVCASLCEPPSRGAPQRSALSHATGALARIRVPRAWPICSRCLRGDLALLAGAGALLGRSRHARSAHARSQQAASSVIELKADEDLHLPMQALDYWIRVRALNADRQRTPMQRSATLRLRARRLLSRCRSFELGPAASFWQRPHSASIPPICRYCAISRPRSTGN